MDTQIKDSYCHNFGYYSIASLIIKYSEFVSSLQSHYDDDSQPHTTYETMSCFSVLKDHYNTTSYVDNGREHIKFIEKTNNNEGVIYHYDFNHYYENDDALHDEKKSMEFSDKCIAMLESGAFYIYIITTDRNLVISSMPIPIQETLINTFRSKITHTNLAKRYGLSCYMAGEIIFIKSKDNKIRGIYANNKSGHFRPGNENIELAKSILSDKLKISNADIFFLTVQR